VRDIEFRVPVQCSILSERRVFKPYGLEGGGDASRGANYWVRRVDEGQGEKGDGDEGAEYAWISLGGKNTAHMQKGERVVIYTPGGGGWGVEGGERNVKSVKDEREGWRKGSYAQRVEMQESSV